ncbi:MAG: hypothetical protein JKX76_01005, partial [Colwellia sp.]|nr:hypothetical protein [Colwellia sp.]
MSFRIIRSEELLLNAVKGLTDGTGDLLASNVIAIDSLQVLAGSGSFTPGYVLTDVIGDGTGTWQSSEGGVVLDQENTWTKTQTYANQDGGTVDTTINLGFESTTGGGGAVFNLITDSTSTTNFSNIINFVKDTDVAQFSIINNTSTETLDIKSSSGTGISINSAGEVDINTLTVLTNLVLPFGSGTSGSVLTDSLGDGIVSWQPSGGIDLNQEYVWLQKQTFASDTLNDSTLQLGSTTVTGGGGTIFDIIAFEDGISNKDNTINFKHHLSSTTTTQFKIFNNTASNTLAITNGSDAGLGIDSNGDISIGGSLTAVNSTVSGTLELSSGTLAVGNILTDVLGNGVATWQVGFSISDEHIFTANQTFTNDTDSLVNSAVTIGTDSITTGTGGAELNMIVSSTATDANNYINMGDDVSVQYQIINDTATNELSIKTLAGNGMSMDSSGDTLFTQSMVISGNLSVNGTTTTLNTEDLLIKDKNIELGVTASPTDITAANGGITLQGATDKSLLWKSGFGPDLEGSWKSSENFDLQLGKEYTINNDKITLDNVNDSTTRQAVTESAQTFKAAKTFVSETGANRSTVNIGDDTTGLGTGGSGLVLTVDATGSDPTNTVDFNRNQVNQFQLINDVSANANLGSLLVGTAGGVGMTLDNSGNAAFGANVGVAGTFSLTSGTQTAGFVLSNTTGTGEGTWVASAISFDKDSDNTFLGIQTFATDGTVSSIVNIGSNAIKYGDGSSELNMFTGPLADVLTNTINFGDSTSTQFQITNDTSVPSISMKVNGGNGIVVDSSGVTNVTGSLSAGAGIDVTVGTVNIPTGSNYQIANTDITLANVGDVSDGSRVALTNDNQTISGVKTFDSSVNVGDSTGAVSLVINPGDGTDGTIAFNEGVDSDFYIKHSGADPEKLQFFANDLNVGMELDLSGNVIFDKNISIGRGEGTDSTNLIVMNVDTNGGTDLYDNIIRFDRAEVNQFNIFHSPSATVETLSIMTDTSVGLLFDNAGKATFNGEFALTSGTLTSGFVLTTDISGNATWQTPAISFDKDIDNTFTGIQTFSTDGAGTSLVNIGPTTGFAGDGSSTLAMTVGSTNTVDTN